MSRQVGSAGIDRTMFYAQRDRASSRGELGGMREGGLGKGRLQREAIRNQYCEVCKKQWLKGQAIR